MAVRPELLGMQGLLHLQQLDMAMGVPAEFAELADCMLAGRTSGLSGLLRLSVVREELVGHMGCRLADSIDKLGQPGDCTPVEDVARMSALATEMPRQVDRVTVLLEVAVGRKKPVAGFPMKDVFQVRGTPAMLVQA